MRGAGGKQSMNGDTPSPHDSPSIGIDMEQIGRFEPEGSNFVSPDSEQVFTREEHVHCEATSHPAACYATHWCAKEAAVKALWPWLRLDPRRLSLVHPESESLLLLVDGEPLSDFGVVARVSVSRSTTTAFAVVVARRR